MIQRKLVVTNRAVFMHYPILVPLVIIYFCFRSPKVYNIIHLLCTEERDVEIIGHRVYIR
jgi:hypothetical protein